MNQFQSTSNNGKFKKWGKNKNETIKIILPERIKVYEILNNIANRLKMPNATGIYTKRYLDQETIPYICCSKIKWSAVFIESVRIPIGQFFLPEIEIGNSKVLTIYVTEGTLQISNKTQKITVYPMTSCTVDTRDPDLEINIRQAPTNFTILIRQEMYSSYIQNNDEKIFTRSVSSLTPFDTRKNDLPTRPIKHINPNRIILNEWNQTPLPKNLKPVPKSSQPISYIRAELPITEIQDRILFLDGEFVLCGKRHAPASLSILNYEGKIILHKLIKPEEEVTNYLYKLTGFNQNALRNGIPERTMIKYLNELLTGKILIGSDLSLDIKTFKINVDNLLGIRDLSTALAVRRRLNIWNGRSGLAKMAYHFWKLEIHKGTHNSLDDVIMIRDVYTLLENEYEDDYYNHPDEEESILDNIEIEDYSESESHWEPINVVQVASSSTLDVLDDQKRISSKRCNNIEFESNEGCSLIKIPKLLNEKDKIAISKYLKHLTDNSDSSVQ